MKRLSKLSDILQILFIGLLLLTATVNCCPNEHSQAAKQASGEHDCCRKDNSKNKKHSDHQNCIDCQHGIKIVESGKLDLAKLILSQTNVSNFLLVSSDLNAVNYHFQTERRSDNFSNAPNPLFASKLISPLALSPNAPPLQA